MTSRVREIAAAALLCVAVLAAEVAALQPPRELFVLDTGTGHSLGEAVSIDGDVAVISAPGDDRADGRGAAYVYERHEGHWSRVARLPGNGHAVVSGRTILHGRGSPEVSEVRAYEHDGEQWVDRGPLVPSSREGVGAFAIDGDTALVGVLGGLYVFERTPAGFRETERLEVDGTGWLSFSGDTFVAGHFGAAHVYERIDGRWRFAVDLATLVPGPENPNYSTFGRAVSTDGDRIVVGEFLDSTVGTAAGAIFVFEKSDASWHLAQKLIPPAVVQSEHFGRSVAIRGDLLVAGSRWLDGSGAVYVWQRDSGRWGEATRIRPDSTRPGDGFSTSLAISSDTIVVGAPSEDEIGVAHFFAREDPLSNSARLTVTEAVLRSLRGRHVAIDGAHAVVCGQVFDDQSRFSHLGAYLLRRIAGRWTFVQRLVGGTPATFDDGCGPVALDDGVAAVSVWRPPDEGGARDYTVHVFERRGGSWAATSVLTPTAPPLSLAAASGSIAIGTSLDGVHLYEPDGDGWREAGRLLPGLSSRVALDGRTLAVAASGAVYLFENRDGDWQSAGVLSPIGLEENTRFGLALALDGRNLLVGARRSVHAFTRTAGGWRPREVLRPRHRGLESEGYGKSLALDGNLAVIGSVGDDNDERYPGIAYVLTRRHGRWREVAQITTGRSYDTFATAVALSNNELLVADSTYEGGTWAYDLGGASRATRRKLATRHR